MEDEKLPPGTVRLIDTSGTIQDKHASNPSEADIVLHPRPSDDPEDPLYVNFAHIHPSVS